MNNFVWLVPATSDPAQRKGFYCYERTRAKDPVIRSHIGSIKRAASIIGEIWDENPNRPVIVDTGVYAGRELLRRVTPLLTFDAAGFESRFFLTQQFPLVKGCEFAADESVGQGLPAARSVGGKRPCCVFDPLIAKVGDRGGMSGRTRSKLSTTDARRMTEHPLCRVPLFFVEEAKRFHGSKTGYDAKLLERDILQLALCVAALCQSPFPVDRGTLVFTGNEVPGSAQARSVLDDFIFEALSGPTKGRSNLARKSPVACETVRRTDKFLAELGVAATKIFESRVNRNRYARIRSFLDLLWGAWAVSFYKEAYEGIPIVDLWLLQKPARTRFEQFLTTLRTT